MTRTTRTPNPAPPRRASTPAAATLVAWMALVAAACGGDAPGAASGIPEATVRDSAGVTIVENAPLPADPPTWALGPEPLVGIGVLEGDPDYQLFRVQDALRLDDGRVLVLNAGSHQVRAYAPDGSYLDAWGGQGEGPGEFRSPGSLVPWPGDSVAVWDGGNQRMTVFGTDGALVRSFPLPAIEGVGLPGFQDVFPDGSAVVSAIEFGGEPTSGRVRLPVRLAVVDAEGALVGDLGAHAGTEAVMRISESAINIFRSPYTRRYVLGTHGRQVIMAPSEHFELRFWTRSGDLARIVRLAERPYVPTAADRAAELDRRLQDVPEERRAGIRTMYQELPIPDTLPAMAGVMVDELDHVWVEPFRLATADGPTRWIVLGPAGQVVATAALPQDMTVHQIGADFVVGRVTDDLGVERVEVWPLRRTGATAAPD
ncbi:MAG: hypothetical protein RJQ04_02515 [Longimicrobiales bacterium]